MDLLFSPNLFIGSRIYAGIFKGIRIA